MPPLAATFQPDSLDALRAQIRDADRWILDLCWSHYKLNGKHLKIREAYFKLGKPQVDATVARLTGNLIRRSWGDTPGDNYQITHLGALVSSDGSRLEELIKRFLVAVRTAYEENHELRGIDSNDLKRHLDATGTPLAAEEIRDLGRVLVLGVRLVDTGVVGPQPDGTWYINMGDGIDDIRRISDLREFLQRELVKNFDPSEPVSEIERANRQFASNRLPISFHAPGSNANPNSADVQRPQSAMESSELNPWPVLRSILLRMSSYEVPEIIDRSGLTVDWMLTEKENYSHKARLAAYRPRIDVAYQSLSTEQDRLRVAYIVARELASRGLGEELSDALREIGWEVRDNRLIPSAGDVRELFFPDQSPHYAYVEIRAILQKAKNRIAIVDPYVDQSILTLLSTCAKQGMSIRILTSKLPFDFGLEAKKWRSQNTEASLEVRTTKEFHDRFIVVDDTECWHIGCSIKDAGNKAFMLSELEDGDNRAALLAQIAKSWGGGKNVP